MISPFSAAVKGLLDILAADATLTSYIPATKFRVGSAESTLHWPYLVISQMYGGDTNRSPRAEADLMVRVLVHSQNQTEARIVMDRIYTLLRGATPTYPDTWGYTSPVTHINNVEDDDIIQQNKVFFYGHDFRVRMAE